MIPTLFPDQQRSIERLRESIRTGHKAPLLQGETGSGKSVMAAYMIASSRAKERKSAFIVPRRDLLHQMAGTFNKFEISHSFVADKMQFNPHSMTHICTLGTLVNRAHLISPNIVFLDETHFSMAQLAKLIAYYRGKGALVIGLTATPKLPKGEALSKYYDDLILGPTIRELIELKRLSDYRLFAPSRPDLSKIKVQGGDYVKTELQNFMENDNVLIGDAVQHYKQHAMGKLNITFCASIAASEKTAQAFRNAGVPSMHMDGETDEDVRRNIAKAFARRELLNICSVDLMTFGYDLAAASGMDTAVIESMSDLSPTKSLSRQRQKNGRVLRYKDFPALIFDHSNNWKENGFPCEVIPWTLNGETKSKGGERTTPVRSCPECYFVHTPAGSCPNCGHEYEVDSREIKQIEGELEEISPEEIKRKARMAQGMAKTLPELIAHFKQQGTANPEGRARHVWAARQAKLSVSLHVGGKQVDM